MNKEALNQMTSLVVTDRADRLIVEIRKPETRNAIDQQLIRELHEVCARLEVEPRVLIITGLSEPEEGVFASGTDIDDLLDQGRDEALLGVTSTLFQRITQLPMPVVAAVDGFALGDGAELAMAANFRIGTPRTRFGTPETGLGIMAAAGATWRLKELVGEAIASEMLLAGRILSAQEALDLRLVTELHQPEDLLAAALALTDRIVAQDPLAVRVTKVVLRMPREAHPSVDVLAQAILFASESKRSRMHEFVGRPSA